MDVNTDILCTDSASGVVLSAEKEEVVRRTGDNKENEVSVAEGGPVAKRSRTEERTGSTHQEQNYSFGKESGKSEADGGIAETGKTSSSVAVIPQIICTNPRGKMDIIISSDEIRLKGKGKLQDYVIPISTVERIFALQHASGRQIFFVMALNSALLQGKSKLNYVVFELPIGVDLAEILDSEKSPKSESEKTSVDENGPISVVVPKMIAGATGLDIVTNVNSSSRSTILSIECSYKGEAGYLYPLKDGFIFLHKPAMHIAFSDIFKTKFPRYDDSTKYFDFVVEMKDGTKFTFDNLQKSDYCRLNSFDIEKSVREMSRNVGRKDVVEDTDKEESGEFCDDKSDSDDDDYIEDRARKEEEQDDEEDEDSDSEAEPDEKDDSYYESSSGTEENEDKEDGEENETPENSQT